MNKIKSYDKKSRLSVSLSLFFGIYSFYKYEDKTTYRLTISDKSDEMSFSITESDQTKTFQITRNDILFMKHEKENSIKEVTYNPNKNTLRKVLKVEVENGKDIVIDDYTDKEGITKRDILFDFDKQVLNKIKNGKSKN